MRTVAHGLTDRSFRRRHWGGTVVTFLPPVETSRVRTRSRHALLAILFLLLAGSTAMACDPAGPSEATRPTVAGVAYGDDEAHVMDVFVPAPDVASPTGDATTRPVFVLVHGGGWTSGSRASHHPLAATIVARGWVVATVDYRLAPVHEHPAAVDDVHAAVRYLHDNAEDLGVSPDHVVVAGESAGAHLAAMVALSDRPPRVAGLVAWSGLYELDQLPARVDGTAHEWLLHHLWAYLGCSDLADPGCLASAQEASPVRLASADDPPALLLHSTDELAPLEDARSLHEALRAARVSSRLEVHEGTAHGRSLIGGTEEVVADFLAELTRQDAISPP